MALQFLTRADLETRLFDVYIDESVQEDLEALDKIEAQSIATIKSKLRNTYDVNVIFSDQDYEGKDLIVSALTSIVTYRAIRRNAARKVPTDAADDYKEAMKWLDDVRDGNENPGLPLLDIPIRQEVLWGNSNNDDHLF
jgi:phage gp36-like protein